MLLIGAWSSDDHDLTIDQICEKYGYPFDKYTVTTNDGYILQTFRVKHGKDQTYQVGRPVVLFKHGAFDSSDALFIHGEFESVAFFLANAGYDVWIANTRGNKYSRNHTHLNPDKDPEFWDFTFTDEYEDDLANIQLVLSTTGQQKLAYIGHSEAAAGMLYGLTQDVADWLKERISIFVAIAPISRMDHMKSVYLRALGVTDFGIKVIKFFGIHEWFGNNPYRKSKFNLICNYFVELCEFNMYTISEGAFSVMDKEALRVYLGHFPGGLSVKILDHELQMYRAEKFQVYDYGVDGNVRHYGQEHPPEIDIEDIWGVKIAMFVGEYDLLGDTTDNRWLRDELGNNVIFYNEYEQGHGSFYFGSDMSYLNDVVKILDNNRN